MSVLLLRVRGHVREGGAVGAAARILVVVGGRGINTTNSINNDDGGSDGDGRSIRRYWRASRERRQPPYVQLCRNLM